ncbi:SAM-dependent methyltransferase [Streptomyces sp. NPDC012637]|uniref:SAM-dependent methyltransferase n=1 Tax=Streptomyces sp. NPDC012637 TaxID=3364842 RepID=UPI0036E4769A
MRMVYGASSARGIDITTPSMARMHDFLLGGIENYESDRAACTALLRVAPDIRETTRDSRGFLERAVRVLAAEHGVRQFLDLGSGLPTRRNVHQIARDTDPTCRVVYVDRDPIVLAHGRTMLEENSNTLVVEADLSDSDRLFEDADVRRLIRHDEPTAVLLVSVLHCFGEEAEPAEMIRRIVDRLAPGSFLVLCQLVSDQPDVRHNITGVMQQVLREHWGRVRSKGEVAAFFHGMSLLSPGLANVADWRPAGRPAPTRSGPLQEWGGVAQI